MNDYSDVVFVVLMLLYIARDIRGFIICAKQKSIKMSFVILGVVFTVILAMSFLIPFPLRGWYESFVLSVVGISFSVYNVVLLLRYRAFSMFEVLDFVALIFGIFDFIKKILGM